MLRNCGVVGTALALEESTVSKSKSHTGYRDSKNGQFVTERTAERRPASTQKEAIPNPGRGDTGRSGKKK